MTERGPRTLTTPGPGDNNHKSDIKGSSNLYNQLIDKYTDKAERKQTNDPQF